MTTGYTLCKLGWTNPLTDAFSAHPLLGPILDLNDGATYTLVSPEGLELSAPEKTLVPTGNIRTQGERVTRAIYRRNRTAVLRVIFGPATNYASFIASIRTLVRWLDATPATPFCVQWQPPSATSPVYLDVVGAAHGIPADEREWLRLQVEPIELVLLVRPGLRGDRVTLQNLISNPGFEAGSGPGVSVFADSFPNANAYTTLLGAAGTVASNVFTIPNNSQQAFGSPAWGAINQWRVRFQWVTGLTAVFSLHETDVNNRLSAQLDGVNLLLNHLITNTAHTLATVAAALTNGSWYWITLTQFPSAPNTQPDIQAILNADSAGTIGAQVASVGPVATFDAVTALSGRPSLGAAGAAMQVGGAFAGVHTLSLFGPGGWTFNGANGGTSIGSGGWEQATSNTYSGGAVTSYGAARIELPPAGSVNAYWESYSGGAPAGTSAIPASTGQVLQASGYVKSSGLSAGATLQLQLREWDSNGALLRATALQLLTGNQAGWTSLSGSLTLGASTAYISALVQVIETTAGASANGTVWLDNVQVWNVTTTGQSSMPYCELRFPQAPSQLLLTGLLGDLPAPAFVAWGAYLSSWAPNATLSFALGRRAQASANARLVGPSHGFYGAALSPTSTAILDASSYGGSYPQASVNPSWNPRGFSFPPADLLGVYHLFSRFQTAQTAGNLGNVETRIVTQQKQNAWYGTIGDADQLGAYNGPWSFPISQSAVWTVVDSGQVNVPALPAGALTDLSQNFLTPRPQWQDLTAGGSTGKSNWQALVPVDGSLLVGLVNNPSNNGVTVSNQWLWVYLDGLLTNRASIGDTAAATYSIESAPLPAPAHAGGGPGTSSTGAINVNSGADPYLTLDPSVSVAAVSGATTATGGAGVNQLACVVADGAGAVVPLALELRYSPLYLYPR